MKDPFDLQALVIRVCDSPRPAALATLNEIMEWDDEPGSAPNIGHMEFNARLVTAVRVECERRKQPPPWR